MSTEREQDETITILVQAVSLLLNEDPKWDDLGLVLFAIAERNEHIGSALGQAT